MKPTEFEQVLYEKLKEVPKGCLTTYGDLALAVGRPSSARAVGNAMNKNPFAPTVPCHRVVRSDGQIGGFAQGTNSKIKLLKKEGIEIKNNRVSDLSQVLFKF